MTRRPSHPAALTLAELTIALTLFVMLATAGVMLISQTSKADKKAEMEEYLYIEGQALLEEMIREIKVSGIDYEEYYSRTVLLSSNFGENYGDYHQQFFNPGTPAAYGGLCVDGTTPYDPQTSTCTPDFSSFDYDTGQHPYDGTSGSPAPETENAFCEGSATCDSIALGEVDELFLIHRSGNQRTAYVLESETNTVNDSITVTSLAKVVLDGTDTDGNGTNETWACATNYTCDNGNLPNPADLTDEIRDTTNFVPISPPNLSIQSLTFYITPLEDPFKAYAEEGTAFETVQQQPRVTIVMTVSYQLFDSDGNPIDLTNTQDYIGEAPTLTFQTTVNTGLSHLIPGYNYP